MEEKIRCGIYTRKSIENATLDRDFNSLVAQREACESYITSQKSKGWVCLEEHYDDGGYSGGNMNRPAMEKLKEDIIAGKIDMVVCYKIDRLSRSIIDFVELQRFFESHNVHFVSVTQDINTSNSSGRMLLNILITFAAFERDLIIDRVKAAIDGGKKRGKFCGGVPVLGYTTDLYTKKLVIKEDEAKKVRLIYDKYLTLGSVQKTVAALNQMGMTTRDWTSITTGRKHTAKPWNTGSVHRVLSSPIYAGYVKHYDTVYEGEQEAIIPREMWEKVQEMLETHSPTKRGTSHKKREHPFADRIRCGCCDCALTPAYSKRRGQQYCYYICSKNNKDSEHVCPLGRIPAGELEQAVVTQLTGLFHAPSVLQATLQAVREQEEPLRASYDRDIKLYQERMNDLKTAALHGDTNLEEIKRTSELLRETKRKRQRLKDPISEEEIMAALGDAAGLWQFMFPGTRKELIRLILGEIVVYPDKISMVLKVDGMKDLAGELAVGGYFNTPHHEPTDVPVSTQEVLDDGSIRLTVDMTLKRVNGHRRVVIPAPGEEQLRKTSLLKAIRTGKEWTEMLINGEAKNVLDLSHKVGFRHAYVSRILSLATIAPDIVDSIVAGTEPDNLSIAKLTMQPIPLDWNEQRRMLGFGEM